MSNKPQSKRLSAEDVKAAASGRWLEILTSVAGIPAEALDGKGHPCPKCGGTDRFSFIDNTAGAVLCRKCFSKQNGDGLAAVAWMCGCDFPYAIKKVAGFLGLSPTATNGKPRIVDTYDYRDEGKELVFQVVRYDPKDFRQRRPKEGGGWDWKVKGVRVVAAVVHCVEYGPAGCIEVATIRAATEIAAYLVPHAEAVLDLMQAKEDSTNDDAQYVLRWIKRHGRKQFTKSEAQHHGKRRFPKADAIDKPLEELVKRGYIRQKPSVPAGPGRPPSPAYEVNPAVFADTIPEKRSHNSRNPRESSDNGNSGNNGSASSQPETTDREQVTI
jgi:hypothetical protein